MIHNAWGGSMGVAKDLRKQADILEKISNEIANVYLKKSNLSKDEIHAMMEEETWMTAKESIEAGFVDELTESLKMVAKYDVSKFKNITEEKIKSILLNKKTEEIMSKNSENKSILEKIKSIFAESSDITPKAVEEEEEMEQEEEEKIEDAEEMPEWYKKTYEEMKERVQNLEDAVADLKADKENAKAELLDALGQLETSNETIVALGTEMAKLGATPTHLSPLSDPSPIKVEDKVDANTDSYNALADLLKNK
jgi:predicted RNase H-like nuclease (RuvC/YqgF family)